MPNDINKRFLNKINELKKPDPLPFMVQASQPHPSNGKGKTVYELYIPYLNKSKITLKYIKSWENGCLLGLEDEQGGVVEVGDANDSLPKELAEQIHSELGLLLIEVAPPTPLGVGESRYHLLHS